MTITQYYNEVTNKKVDLTEENLVEINNYLIHSRFILFSLNSLIEPTTPGLGDAINLAIDGGLGAFEESVFYNTIHKQWMEGEIEDTPEDVAQTIDVLYNLKDGASGIVVESNIHNDVAYGGLNKLESIAQELGLSLEEE